MEIGFVRDWFFTLPLKVIELMVPAVVPAAYQDLPSPPYVIVEPNICRRMHYCMVSHGMVPCHTYLLWFMVNNSFKSSECVDTKWSCQLKFCLYWYMFYCNCAHSVNGNVHKCCIFCSVTYYWAHYCFMTCDKDFKALL